MEENKSIKLVTIHTFSNPFEVEVVKGRLEAEGIPAFVMDQNVGFTIGTTLLQGYRLQVKSEDFIKAKFILKNSLEEK